LAVRSVRSAVNLSYRFRMRSTLPKKNETLAFVQQQLYWDNKHLPPFA
jgi:hypothetical protein